MKTCEYAGAVFTDPRSHPWVDTAGSPECVYYDLTSTPEHIRSSLEDFRPWSHYEAIEDFYLLLTALNHPKSALESNDCAFTGPQTNENPDFRWGVVGTTIVPVRYLALAERNGQQFGSQLMISFWAWGNSEAETMLNVARLMKNLSQALLHVSALATASG